MLTFEIFKNTIIVPREHNEYLEEYKIQGIARGRDGEGNETVVGFGTQIKGANHAGDVTIFLDLSSKEMQDLQTLNQSRR